MALGSNLTKQKKEETDTVQESDIVSKDDTIIRDEIAEELEGTDTTSETTKNLLQFCVFKTNNEEYAIPIDLVQEVVKFKKPTPLPQMPPYILGMTNIRGNVYGVLDIAQFFSLDSEIDHNYLLVLDHEELKMTIGIPEVPDSLIVEEDDIEILGSSAIKSRVGQKYLKGVIKKENRMIIYFDIEGIISSDKFTVAS